MNNYLVLSENPSNSLGLDGAREEFVHDEPTIPGMMMPTYPALSTVNVRELLESKSYLQSNIRGIVFHGKDMARYVVPVFWEMVGSNMPPCFVYHGNDLLNSQLPFTFPAQVVLRLYPATSPMDPTADEEWVKEVAQGKAEVVRDDRALTEWMQREPPSKQPPYKCPKQDANVHKHVLQLQIKICKFFAYPALFPAE